MHFDFINGYIDWRTHVPAWFKVVAERYKSCPGPRLHVVYLSQFVLQFLKILISPERSYPVAKQTENNKLTNLTANIKSQHIQHGEVGNT